MESRLPASSGLLGSVQSLAEILVRSAHDRLDLFALELHEEKFRLVQTIIWISAAIFSGMMAITFASLTLVYFFWQSARLAVLCGLALIYTGTFVVVARGCRNRLVHQPKPFAATLGELAQDRACIRPEN